MPRTALLCAIGLLATPARADHFSGATISYDCLGGNQYRVWLDLYLDCAGTAITPHTLNFSNNCGVSFSLPNLMPVETTEVSPLCPAQQAASTCNGGTLPSFRKHRIQVTLFLSPCNKWTIDWHTCCRNTTQNVSLTPGMYVAATLNNAGGLCDRSPRFIDVGVPYACVNQPVAYNLGAYDPDGHAMSFSLIAARFATPVPTPVTYQPGFSATQPIPGIAIDPVTGQLAFTPTAIGYYVVVVEARSFAPSGALIGTVMRDLMFAVIACDGTPPQTQGFSSGTGSVAFSAAQFIACPGGGFCLSLVFTDPQPAQSISVLTNAASVLPGATFTQSGGNPATGSLCWDGTGASLPATILFQASDNACPIANTSSFVATAIDCAFLPVELLSFTAEAGRHHVRIAWRSASETDALHYAVERSPDGQAFAAIGRVDAIGGAAHNAYAFADRQPIAGVGYYRLRMVDADGAQATGPVLPVLFAPAAPLTAALDELGRWHVQGAEPHAPWRLMAVDGRLLAGGRADEQGRFRIAWPAPEGAALLLGVAGRGLLLPAARAGEPMVVSAR